MHNDLSSARRSAIFEEAMTAAILIGLGADVKTRLSA
jgi:hypothetical protein